jgi:hypothetical protein
MKELKAEHKDAFKELAKLEKAAAKAALPKPFPSPVGAHQTTLLERAQQR